MTISKNQQQQVTNYVKKHYDSILVYLYTKGKKDVIKEFAQKNRLSVNQYINKAIDNQLQIDGYTPDNTQTGEIDKK